MRIPLYLYWVVPRHIRDDLERRAEIVKPMRSGRTFKVIGMSLHLDVCYEDIVHGESDIDRCR